MIDTGIGLYKTLYKETTIKLNTRLLDTDSFLSVLPKDLPSAYVVKGNGYSTITKNLKTQLEIVDDIVSRYGIKTLTMDEVKERYKNFINILEKLDIGEEVKTNPLAEYLNNQIKDEPIDFRFNSKMFSSYFVKLKVVVMDERPGSRTYTFRKGPKYDLCPVILAQRSVDNPHLHNVEFDSNSRKFLKEHLVDIFYEYYGKNSLNLIKLDNSKNYDNDDKNYIFIFDVDATVFDTDSLREKRSISGCDSISEEELKEVPFIKNFESLFLNKNSPYYLKEHKVYFITSSKRNYARTLFLTHGIDHGILYSACGNYKSEIIKKITEGVNPNEQIIAFGDDEKDALLYEKLLIPYILVKNGLGYDVTKDLDKQIINPKKYSFRNTFMYDIIKINRGNLEGFVSKYFDDIVVYYRRYYDKSNNFKSLPVMDGIKALPKLTYDNFGKSKYFSTLHFLDDFLGKDLANLEPDDNTIIAKVPGSNEIMSTVGPIALILDKLKYKGFCINKSLLLRSNEVEQNHGVSGSNRHISKHLDSIYCTKELHGETIYLFDDIVSSGATMVACVEKLYNNGAGHVVCFCLARTCSMNNIKLLELEGKER